MMNIKVMKVTKVNKEMTARILGTLILALVFIMPVFAEKPKLEEDIATPIVSTAEAGKALQFNLRYTDKDGDKLTKLTMMDIHDNQRVPYSDYKPEGQPEQSMTVSFKLATGLGGDGAHSIYFEGENEAGEKVRYPEDTSQFKTISVIDNLKKWLLVGGVSLFCILALPYIVYLIARSINKQGNPSSAARMSLLVGILVALGVLISQFFGNALVIGVGVVLALILLVLVLTRR
jgi:hypothetical protein